MSSSYNEWTTTDCCSWRYQSVFKKEETLIHISVRGIIKQLSQNCAWTGNTLDLSPALTRHTEGNRKVQSIPREKDVFLPLRAIYIFSDEKTIHLHSAHSLLTQTADLKKVAQFSELCTHLCLSGHMCAQGRTVICHLAWHGSKLNERPQRGPNW